MISGTDSILYKLNGTSVNITGLSTGNYSYKISATNDQGEGPKSSVITILAASVPSKMYPVTIALSGSNVALTWAAPSNNGADIT